MKDHVIIPDTQVKPGVRTDHLGWIGEYIGTKFVGKDVRVVHLGDHADMPSLSAYDVGKKSAEGRRYDDDIEAANAGLARLTEPIRAAGDALVALQKRRHEKVTPWTPELHILDGNHENRITRAVESDAKLERTISLDDLDYEGQGWTRHPFLEIVDLDGVWYSHYFANPMSGRPYGGQSIDTRLKTVGHSFTMGHQQTLMYGLRFVGPFSMHGLVAGACYLHDEDYKGPQGNAHWRGIVICHEVENGSYDPMFVSLDYLCRRYEGVSLREFNR